MSKVAALALAATILSPLPVMASGVQLSRIAGRSQAEVAAVLGQPTKCEKVKIDRKTYPKCYYTHGTDYEIVYVNKKADYIWLDGLTRFFTIDAPLAVGMNYPDAPTFSNEHVIRWEGYSPIYELSVFPAGSAKVNIYACVTGCP